MHKDQSKQSEANMKMAAKQTCFTFGLPLQLGRYRSTATVLSRNHTFSPLLNRTRVAAAKARPNGQADAFPTFRTASTADALVEVPPEPKATGQTDPDAVTEPEIFRVTEGEAGKRLDKVLASRFPDVSRSYLQALLDDGNVLVDGSLATTKSRKTIAGEAVEVRFVTPERDLLIEPEDIPLDILYEDEHLVVINKPAGMVVHPAPGNWKGTLLHALTFRYPSVRAMGGPRPGIVHRLDKGTSGVIVAALTAEAQRGLMSQFAERQVRKEYVAITVGNPAGEGCVSRTIAEAIGRSATDRLRMAVLAEESGGKAAVSRVRVCGVDGRGLLHVCSVGISSGRTHQIRVHLRHARAPVLGDDLYGARDVNWRFRGAAKRAMLHALRIGFAHPVTGEAVEVGAGLAEDMRTVVERNIMPDEKTWPEGW